MIRIATFLLVAALFYFGLTSLIEFRSPEVKDFSSDLPASLIEVAPLPDIVLGHFNIDQPGSQKWLDSQKQLTIDSLEAFTDKHIEQTELGFNGKDIWFSNQEQVYPVEVLEVTAQYVRFSVQLPESEELPSYTAYLQWDKKGAVWYSDYNLLQDGKKQLYRARYVRAKAK